MAVTEATRDEESSQLFSSGAIPNQSGKRETALVAGGAALLAGLVFMLVRGGLTDDAYITIDFARNLAFHGHWGMIEQEFSNTATSPLNVLALAALTFLLRQPVLALGALFVLANAVLAVALHRSARHSGFSRLTVILGTLLVLTNPFLLSSVGLEMTLASALLGLLLLGATTHNRVLFGVAAGLLALTRLDLGIFVVVLLLGRPALWRRFWRWLVPACLVSLPWFGFSWFAFGSAVPDTLVLKQMQEAWGSWDFGNGLRLYYEVYPTATTAALVTAALGVLALPVWLVTRLLRNTAAHKLHPWALMGVGGIAHFYAYTTLGVPPYHWYYVPSMLGLTMFLAGVIGATAAVAARHRRRIPMLAATVAVVLGTAVFANQARVAVETGTPWQRATITTNWATPSDYARIGNLLEEEIGDATVRSPGEIGTLAYFCECSIVDGLSDRGILTPDINERIAEAGPVTATLLRANYRNFTPVEPREVDYVLTRVMGRGSAPAWNIDSPWTEPSHLVLKKVDQ
ncbi:hypothetical protein IL38_17705 [Actinopolyspora erythraea]|uniref:Glycosyltransferase RgtA/B/C/D-like domain-containing protein n=1 Tax=Actinopolyspora erythraea TaxID=414996 RepID=A0ABR4X1F4_9ACTN|nr:hypothetical protein IL38_17705 [Actinopolyspora erythraea]